MDSILETQFSSEVKMCIGSPIGKREKNLNTGRSWSLGPQHSIKNTEPMQWLKKNHCIGSEEKEIIVCANHKYMSKFYHAKNK